ncbi:hypothetical protein [Teichococcus aestuarii]|uniref:hypothetical protein n=1 Tax=Teichococcus aestuarii TaxID=568898 RepID=UPI00360DD154
MASSLAAALAPLAALSARLGANRDLVQGAGGNTSLKRGDRELWVKASGTGFRPPSASPSSSGSTCRRCCAA